MYTFCTIWNIVETCVLETKIDGGSSEDHSHCEPVNTKKTKTIVYYVRTHSLLQEVYKRICTDNCANGEVANEGCDLSDEEC